MIIDFHTHIFPSFFRTDRKHFFHDEPAFQHIYESPKAKIIGQRELIESMDEEGVQRSVIFGFPWEQEDLYKRHNDYILEAVQNHPGRFIGFCCFSPLSPGAAKEAERCLSSGLSGVGEIAVYQSGLTREITENFSDVMTLCHERDVPLLLHTNEPVGHAYAGKTIMTLSEIYHFVKRYPSNTIVLAHWGGGLFFYALMKREVSEALENVWFDTAASPFLYRPEVYKTAGKIIGFEKILLGSDYPLLKPTRYLKEMETADLDSETLSMISGGNAARLLGLPS